MMYLSYMKRGCLDQLQANISRNSELYKRDVPWLDEYFGGAVHSVVSSIAVSDVSLEPGPEADVENTRRLHSALCSLTPAQASDERLWTHLTHVTFWAYMRARWPVDAGTNTDVLKRYFYSSSKSPVRNGIARLWWYGHLSYDQTRDDPYELTAVLVRRHDVAQNLLERSLGRSRRITKAILEAILDRESAGKEIDREQYRNMLKHLNRLGGVTILDALAENDIADIIRPQLS